jgi:hypothetical protein
MTIYTDCDCFEDEICETCQADLEEMNNQADQDADNFDAQTQQDLA